MSDRIKGLRQRKKELTDEANTLAIKEQDGTISADELKRLDALTAQGDGSGDPTKMGELERLNGQIVREEYLMDQRRSMEPASNPSADTPQEASDRQQPQPKAKAFATLGDQMLAVARAAGPGAVRDPRLVYTSGLGGAQAATGASEGIAADGGFLVQTDFQTELLQNLYDMGEIASRIRKIPVGANSNGIRMNGVDETSRANGSRWGGIQAFWTGEAQQKTASAPKFRQIKMELDKLTGLCYATDELLQDGVALEAWLTQAFTDEFTFKVEDSVINGTGAGMPLGILNSGAVITVPKETNQAAATITAGNVLAMWARLPARSQKDAVWLANVDTSPQLSNLYTVIKNVAGTENVGGVALSPWYTSGITYTAPGFQGSQYAMLQGKPIIPCEYCATLGTPGDLILTDLGQYLAIDKGPAQSASSIHVRFIFDETVFRFVYRFNGQPLWRLPLTPYKGANSLSPYIVLATR